ncbi:MAG: type IV toxin-antitoxin system AbiEi family antitoxin domain-containing protein [Victivallales bacterium]|nr:type IV toxin-antitoxin system AbiEi family antitoxin domain-containing protein [Victivallales bacterium]
MSIIDIRAKIPNDIFTALELNMLLDGYSNKAQRISLMLKKGEIIQIRRGLYAFAEALRKGLIVEGVLANMIYGPSYVSEEFALSYYGLIPEAVYAVTSVCIGRSRSFDTPFGRYAYRYSRSKAYSIGIDRIGDKGRSFLMASPEKALFDKAFFDKRFNGDDPEDYLLEDLRVDLDMLAAQEFRYLDELKPFFCGRLRKLGNYLEGL